ncbi:MULTISPECIES: hypothetical protein [unclassified Roseovarius]|uniref:hypothetical protein n=1 Tax=unclassified Roseovarius TaxID=2614913 RepID=UPI00273E3AF3|nr:MULTISPECIES: hypothetical protein [unclassified Roseovarius]
MSERSTSQIDKFKEAARQLETDDDEERFEKKLKKLVKQKPGNVRDEDNGK